MEKLFELQVLQLSESHFLTLYWAAHAEDSNCKYNITNCFDDMKYHKVTRTKQNAVAIIESLHMLRFIDLREEGNRKNIYISKYGAKALEILVIKQVFSPKASVFLEER